MLPPRSLTACSSLPPEGAAAPAVWQSQSRGPCWVGESPRSLTACSSLPPEGAAAPAARQSRFRGPCWREEPPRSLTACSSGGLAGRSSRDASPLSPVQSCSSSFGAAGSSPSGAARLRPGPSTGSGQAKAGSAAHAGLRTSGSTTRVPRDWLCQTAGTAPLRGEQATRSELGQGWANSPPPRGGNRLHAVSLDGGAT
jgi:hypothetical protein